MNTKIDKILSLKYFFTSIQKRDNISKFTLKPPSILLMQKIHYQWLQSIWSKADKTFSVKFDNNNDRHQKCKTLPAGFISPKYINISETIKEFDITNLVPLNKTLLEFRLIIPERDMMQYFVQWQRYRKYWWSMITTTPSLFAIDDIKYKENGSEVDIVANVPDGKQSVENISIIKGYSDGTALIKCKTSLEDALYTTLLDGILSSTREGYLRLHRIVAPYQFAFALEYSDVNSKESLSELAQLINSRLNAANISTWYPGFNLNIQDQIIENLEVGAVYTIVLNENTLDNGIFHLLNSSTMLKEQVHIADFDTYAALICGIKTTKH